VRLLGKAVIAVLGIHFAHAEVSQNTWNDLLRKGTLARHEGRYVEARSYLEAAHEGIPADAGDAKLVDLDDELGGVYELFGDWPAAERVYQEAIAILNRHPQEMSGLRASVMAGMGSFRASQGRLEEAVSLLETALNAIRSQRGERDPGVVNLKSSLGQLYLLEGRFNEAEALLREVNEVHKASLAPQNLDRIVSASSLGYLYMLEARYESAEPILRQTMSDSQKLGDSHPVLAFTLSNLADLYRSEGKPERADPLYKRALAIYETSLGPNSQKVAEVLMDRSIDFITDKKYGTAERDLSRALDILRGVNGTENPSVALAEQRLATVYSREARYPEAEAC
jgi:tetratricopeptide (TPR) repeat protein